MANKTGILSQSFQISRPQLQPLPPLLTWISDFHLSLLLPVCAYWFMSGIFWYIDKKNLWSQYRLHTPAEFKHRNRVSKVEVLRSVIMQQALQTVLGLLIGYLTSPGDLTGAEDFDAEVWAGRVQQARGYVSWIVVPLGIDVMTLRHQIQSFAATYNSSLSTTKVTATLHQMVSSQLEVDAMTGLAAWEKSIGKVIYWVLEPGCRFGLAIFFSDSWQYFWHRAMHANSWMYRNMHAHHHKIYVPYAFGAFYNTISEAFILDTVGTTLSLMLSGLTIRQAICFSTISVMKGVDDHCGYRLPWDPLQWFNEQNTEFHDIHHQSWGIKHNYSQLYTTFWDHVCDTVCPKTNEEVEKLYQNGRVAANNQEEQQSRKVQ